MQSWENTPLYKIMHPRSIAFWGASKNPMGMGTVQLGNILKLGYQGEIYPIHPREKEVLGFEAYAKIADVPEVVDLAIFVLPTRVVEETLEECGKAGVKSAIIVTAGFGEAGEEGKQQQARLVEIANKYGISFVGPNCIGAVNTHEKLNTTYYPYNANPGFIGMASQSGSFVTQMFLHLDRFGLGFSQAISVGNEAMLDLTDCLEYLGNCPDTKVVAMYIEAIRRGRDFVRVAKEVSKRKPVVAFYVGGSKAGGRAALSHTGAMAGPDLLYSGVFKQCGIVRAETIEELFDFCYVLGVQSLPEGNGVGVLTHSGGPGAAAADAAERAGLNLTEFQPETQKRLREIVPHTASVSNPVDLTFTKSPDDYVSTLPGIMLEDPGIHSGFIYLALTDQRVRETLSAMGGDSAAVETMFEQFMESQAAALSSLTTKYGKPMVGASFQAGADSLLRKLNERNFPVLPSPERAVKAIGALCRYARMRERLLSQDG